MGGLDEAEVLVVCINGKDEISKYETK